MVQKKVAAAKVKAEGSKCLASRVEGEENKAKVMNDFNYRIKSAPSAARQFYNKHLKFSKMNNPEKRKFVEEVIAGNFESEYFRRFEKVAKVDTNSETGTWMSWKQITDLDGEALVNVQIQQKTVITRPHSKLDAEAESTKSLPEHERLEYKKVSEVESTLTSIETGATRSTDAVPPEEDDGDPERDENNKKSMSVIRKTHNAHQNASIGIKMRLGKYKDNRYVAELYSESLAMWKKMQAHDKKLTKFLESAMASDEPIAQADLSNCESIARELDDVKKNLNKKLNVMASVEKQMAPKTADAEASKTADS
ncbi:unnamed protein product [Prorocentrum cordatum]|uniref:Uncharacterized protein n=1 Tax=Prorocentrum cordatum TaxID=2364126 RepID=A0ABN9VPU0_9DINO|nr:unnamed protein product [Polarella glacialis]